MIASVSDRWVVNSAAPRIGDEKGYQVVTTVALEPAGIGQIIGVAAEVGLLVLCDRRFADRPGDEGVDLTRARHGDTSIQSRQGSGGICWSRPPGFDRAWTLLPEP